MSRPSDDPVLRTVRFYDANAEEYVRSTKDLDLSDVYRPFLARVREEGHILDAGCGSGRDALHFRDAGYRVSAFDASPRMVDISSQLLGHEVQLGTFQTLDHDEEFDGVWACASLLHVPRAEMRDVLERLSCALRPGGVLYASFKHGSGEGWERERFFSRYDEDEIRTVVAEVPNLTIERLWLTEDVRPGREERWVNVLLGRLKLTATSGSDPRR